MLYNHTFTYYESDGYNPIFVDATNAFRDNNQVFQLANTQYQSNGYIYGDTGSDIDWASDWFNGVEPRYRD